MWASITTNAASLASQHRFRETTIPLPNQGHMVDEALRLTPSLSHRSGTKTERISSKNLTQNRPCTQSSAKSRSRQVGAQTSSRQDK